MLRKSTSTIEEHHFCLLRELCTLERISVFFIFFLDALLRLYFWVNRNVESVESGLSHE